METQLGLFEPEPSALSYQYFFLVPPEPPLTAEIEKLKKNIHAQIGLSPDNLQSKPHLSLFRLRKDICRDGTMTKVAREVLGSMPPFSVRIKGVDHFVHGSASDTICLTLGDSEPVVALFEVLADAFHLPVKQFTPHITIARNIPRKDYERLGEISSSDLQQDLLCDRVRILKRTVSGESHSNYIRLQDVPLGGR